MDITYSRPRRPMPETTDGKLEDIIRRLGRIEKHLIDIREGTDSRATTPAASAGPSTRYEENEALETP